MSTQLKIGPMDAEQFDVWHRRRREANIARLVTQGWTREQAAELDDADFRRMLPEGLGTPGEHLALFVLHGQAVGFIWVRMRQRSAGIEAFVHDFHLDRDLEAAARPAAMKLVERAFADLGADWIRLNVAPAGEKGMQELGYLPTRYRMTRSLVGAEPLSTDGLPMVRLEPMTDDQFDEYVDMLGVQEAENRARAGLTPRKEAAQAAAELTGSMRENRRDPAHQFLAALDERDDMVGRLWFMFDERPDGLHSMGFDFSVDEDRRGRGYGRAILAATRRLHLERGARSMSFVVYGYNQRAKRLYESIGYQVSQVQVRKDLSAAR